MVCRKVILAMKRGLLSSFLRVASTLNAHTYPSFCFHHSRTGVCVSIISCGRMFSRLLDNLCSKERRERVWTGFTEDSSRAPRQPSPLNAWSLFSYYNLKLTDRRLLDWAGMLVFGSMPKTALQVALALFMQLVYSGFRGFCLPSWCHT